jgi:hypothetical protein
MGKAKPINPDSGIAGRAETVAALMAEAWVDEDHPLLAGFQPGDRKSILAEVERREWAAREAKRLPVLLERLKTWPVSQWGNVFCERPDLEAQLTPEQRRAWAAWLRQVKEGRETDGTNQVTDN